MRPPLLRVLLGGVALALAGAGCSVIVSGDLNEADIACSVDVSGACPTGLACDTSIGRCRAITTAADAAEADETDAEAEDDAEADAGIDAPAGPLPLGGQCRLDSDCKSKICGTSTMLTSAIVAGTGPVCTKTCCTSADCDAGFVCFGSGTGGNYCVESSKAGRPTSGSKTPGVTCSKNADCRSGSCSDGRCLDTCCTSANCAAGTSCRLETVSTPSPAHDVWVCAAKETTSTKAAGATCSEQNECETNTCIGFGTGRICRPPCSDTAGCRTIAGFTNGHCAYATTGSDYFRYCYVDTTATDKAEGATCGIDSECKSDYCDPELRRCAEVCARDADCVDGKVCRPSAAGTPFLRCVTAVR